MQVWWCKRGGDILAVANQLDGQFIGIQDLVGIQAHQWNLGCANQTERVVLHAIHL
jgi:hypothetical protein